MPKLTGSSTECARHVEEVAQHHNVRVETLGADVREGWAELGCNCVVRCYEVFPCMRSNVVTSGLCTHDVHQVHLLRNKSWVKGQTSRTISNRTRSIHIHSHSFGWHNSTITKIFLRALIINAIEEVTKHNASHPNQSKPQKLLCKSQTNNTVNKTGRTCMEHATRAQRCQ